ncbi:MAG: hypothetical protein KBC21_00885 [Candidatus Pacebacteria bacterium]|nr:hypothetical protein [Candidatus Paceibacterota bacterium]
MQTLAAPRGARVVGPQVKTQKLAAGRFVTVSRIQFGPRVSTDDANKIAFGFLIKFWDFKGVEIGDTIEIPRGLVTSASTNKIIDLKVIEDNPLLQLVHATTSSGSIYELHAVK